MELKIILDAALCAVLAAAFFIGLKRGLLKTVWGLAALITAIVLTCILRPYAVDSFKKSFLAEGLHSYVYNVVSSRSEDMLSTACGNIADAQTSLDTAYKLPEKYSEAAAARIAASTENAVASITDTVTDSVVEIASGIFLFIIIRLFLWIIYMILKFAATLPVIRETNRLAGGLAQLLIAAVFLYAAFAVAAIIGTDIFNDTVICNFMYNHNLLLTLIGL
ncbi:MAG: CvpA family protein [Clostridiales bacterium]|nr:CvpA family protein [Clostridiales bacterium]